jgi:hypothetical protein
MLEEDDGMHSMHPQSTEYTDPYTFRHVRATRPAMVPLISFILTHVTILCVFVTTFFAFPSDIRVILGMLSCVLLVSDFVFIGVISSKRWANDVRAYQVLIDAQWQNDTKMREAELRTAASNASAESLKIRITNEVRRRQKLEEEMSAIFSRHSA